MTCSAEKPARRALVVVLGVVEVEAGLELETVQAGDGGRVVGHGRRLGGAGREGADLTHGAASVLEEPEAGGRGEVRSRQGDHEAQQDGAA